MGVHTTHTHTFNYFMLAAIVKCQILYEDIKISFKRTGCFSCIIFLSSILMSNAKIKSRKLNYFSYEVFEEKKGKF